MKDQNPLRQPRTFNAQVLNAQIQNLQNQPLLRRARRNVNNLQPQQNQNVPVQNVPVQNQNVPVQNQNVPVQNQNVPVQNQNQNVPVQNQNQNVPVQNVPVTAKDRRANKFNVASEHSKTIATHAKNARELINDPYRETLTQEMLTTAENSASKSGRVGVDTEMTPILRDILNAKQLASDGDLRGAGALLLTLSNRIESARKTQQEKAEKAEKAKDSASKQTYLGRDTQYKGLHTVVLMALNAINRTEEQLNKSVTKLCTEVNDLLKKSKSGEPDKLNARLVDALEKGAATPGLSEPVKAVAQRVVLNARAELLNVYNARANGKTEGEKAELLLEFGKCVGPNERDTEEKGKSDSFFLKGPDGALKYVMKPIQGESLTSADWVQGGGPVREILASKLNAQLLQSTGLNCRSLATIPVSLDDPSFAEGGTLSKDSKRVGSLQEVAPGGGKTGAQLYDTVPKNAIDRRKFLDSFSEDDCQAIAVRHFLTMDQDAHAGNFLIDKQGDDPGQTRLIPIDAGQCLPSPDAAKRNARALRVTRPPGDEFTSTDLLIPQLPAAQKPFSGVALQAIQALNPTQMAADLKSSYDQLAIDQPDMANKVDPGSFDLVRKSGKFLKLAAQNGLTLYEISQVYGEGFEEVIDADVQSEDAALNTALNTALALKLAGGDKGMAGVNPALFRLGFPDDPTSLVHELRQDQKARILQNQWTPDEWEQHFEGDLRNTELADMDRYFDADAPEKGQIQNQVATQFNGVDVKVLKLYHDFKRKGGDPLLRRSMAGNEATFALEVRKTVAEKLDRFGPIRNAADVLSECGGSANLFKVIGDNMKGRPLDDQLTAFFRLNNT